MASLRSIPRLKNVYPKGPSSTSNGRCAQRGLCLHPAQQCSIIQTLCLAEELQVCCQENRCPVQGLLPLLLLLLLPLLLDLLPQQGVGQEEQVNPNKESRKEKQWKGLDLLLVTFLILLFKLSSYRLSACYIKYS